MSNNQGSMPQYQCHEQVRALKIARVTPNKNDSSITVHFEDSSQQSRTIETAQMRSQAEPASGWYLVEHADGQLSFLPAPQFERNYTETDRKKHTVAA